MPRTAKIYARLQGQRSAAARHVSYLLDGHGTGGQEPRCWTKGIPKKRHPIDAWKSIDHKWNKTKENGKTDAEGKRFIGKNATTMYSQGFISLPNSITDEETERLAKEIQKLFPQKHPVTIVEHTEGSGGGQNKHLHVAYSYRKNGNGHIDYEFTKTFEKRLKATLKKQYKRFGFEIHSNKKEHQIHYKPHTLMRVLLKKHGREKMRNPHFLEAVILPDLKAEIKKYEGSTSNANKAKHFAATKSAAWLTQEIVKAKDLKGFTPTPISPANKRAIASPIAEAYGFWGQPQTQRAKLPATELARLFGNNERPQGDSGSDGEQGAESTTQVRSLELLDAPEEFVDIAEYMPKPMAQQVGGIADRAGEIYAKMIQASISKEVAEDQEENIQRFGDLQPNVAHGSGAHVRYTDTPRTRRQTKHSGMYGKRSTRQPSRKK